MLVCGRLLNVEYSGSFELAVAWELYSYSTYIGRQRRALVIRLLLLLLY
jgi:hypothetical protein